MSKGLAVVASSTSSCIILVGEGGGGVETRSIDSTLGGFVFFTFFSLAFFSSSSTKHLNYSSIDTLFLEASSKM